MSQHISSKINKVALTEVISACVDATQRGCKVIRSQVGTSDDGKTVVLAEGKLKESDDPKSVVTTADIEAQKEIVGSLKATFGDSLKIIGEEDEEDDQNEDDGKWKPLRTDLLSTSNFSSMEEIVDLSDLTIFLDPLDGTREFVEGRLQNVACLVGIATRDGRAIAGAVGVPFPSGEIVKETPKTYYALHKGDPQSSNWGVYPQPSDACISESSNIENNNSENGSRESLVTVFTGDSSNPMLNRATKKALALAGKEAKHVILGGTAAKLLKTSTHAPSISIFHFKTMLWDTCANEALLRAQGGKITDIFGSSLMYGPSSDLGNVLGVVASSAGAGKIHDELCRAMREDTDIIRNLLEKWTGNRHLIDTSNTAISETADIDFKVEAQAIDIARDLDGMPLTREWLEQHVLLSNKHLKYNSEGKLLRNYSVPESDAVRMLMSNGCRIMFDWNNSLLDGDEEKVLPRSAFYKRIVMSDLDHAWSKLRSTPHKLTRDVRSYQVECNFLTSAACQNFIEEAGIRVNRVYGSDLRPFPGEHPEDKIKSRFSMLLEDFSANDGWKQEWLFDKQTAKATLSMFARMHAYFWEGSNFWKKEEGRIGRELEDAVWPNGGYMQPKLQGEAQLEKVAFGWKNRLPSFETDLKGVLNLQNEDLATLGDRVEKIAKLVGDRAHPFAPGVELDSSNLRKYRTFIHGDPKQANIFLRKRKQDNTLELGLIDFQWSGFGLAATDVAHHMAASLNCLSPDENKVEIELLDHYYSSLTEDLIKFGVASSREDVEQNIYPRSIFDEQYEIALLDICRMVFAYAWARWKPEESPTAASLNRNSYNKFLPSVLWLVSKCSSVLSKREKELLRK